MKKKLLDSIDVQSPCNESWDEMFGNNEVRFCSHCAKDVHNLSAMTRAKAEKLVKDSSGKICVRYTKTPKGNIVTAPPKFTQITRRATIAAGVLATSLMLSTTAYSQGEPIVKKDNSAQTQKNGSKKDAVKKELAEASGTITDAAGVIISEVKISLKNLKTKKSVSIRSNDDGNYTFSDVELGDYEMKLEMSGFKTLKLKKIQIKDSSRVVKDHILLTNSSVTVGLLVLNLVD